jgi:hypothetical protein
MATAITSAPSAPTNLPKAKAFVGDVGDKALWIGAFLLAIAAVKVAMPIVGRIPVLGPALATANPSASFDMYGTAPGA